MYDSTDMTVISMPRFEFGDRIIERFCSFAAKKNSAFQNVIRNIGVMYSASI